MWRKLKLPRMRIVRIFKGNFLTKMATLKSGGLRCHEVDFTIAKQYSDFKVDGKKVTRTYISRREGEYTESSFTPSHPHPAK